MSMPAPAELTDEAAGRRWIAANQALLAKALSEFAYEELIDPEPLGNSRYRVVLDNAHQTEYRFRARRGSYGSWFVEPGSIRRDGQEPDGAAATQLVLDLVEPLALTGDTAGHLVRELTATLLADVRLASTAVSAGELADLPYAQLEGYQTGHPWIVPSKGRMGFSTTDTDTYPPEARQPMRLPWLAVSDELATYQAVDGLTSQRLLAGELDEATRVRFSAVLTERGLDPDRYHWLPVHPWQWDETIVPLFAADLARQAIVPLGDGPDLLLPQQSIRTFTNLTAPERHHVKLPLSILNTLVWRGLPTERTEAAPDVTSWVLGLADADPFLRDEARPVLLGEVASVTVRHTALESIPGVPYQYKELLGAIWRQPITSKLDEGEHARTLASLLYVDPDGRSLLAELVERSGLTPREWLDRLFGALVPPLLHFLYRYGVVFSPHGENTIVVFDEHEAPCRLAVKDFVDDVNISAHALPELEDLPPLVDKVLLREPPEFLCQFIHSGLFVGHFRYLADLVASELDVDETQFWGQVRAQILAYQERFSDLADRFTTFDLLTPRIDRLCLNRNRLLLDGYRDRPERPHAAVHGTVPNPLADG